MIKSILTTLFISLLFISCSENRTKRNKKLKFGESNDVIVTVEIISTDNLEAIEFFEGHGKKYFIPAKKLENVNQIEFGIGGKGEGTFNLCTYTKLDTNCSPHYIEGGYRPVLRIIGSTIIMVDPFGSHY